MQMTQRVRISTGLQCNAQCLFCYYQQELNTQTYTTLQIKQAMDLAKRYGIQDIDFSGGEPTLRKDLVDLVRYARSSGFQTISVITNGTRTNVFSYMEKLQKAGINDILVSLHGADADIHDQLTGVPGAYSKILQTLEHALALGIKLRINTVVNGNNVRELEKIAKTILKYQPKAVNFICFNDWVNAGKITGSIGVKYSEASPHIIAAIQTLYPYVPKVTVRYIPFCFMKGYEKHVCNLGQKDYDWDEWIDSIKRLVTDLSEDKRRTYTENINRIWEVHHEEIYPKLSVKEKKSVQRMQEGSLFNNFDCSLASVVHKIENHALRKSYIHGPQCKSCAYEKICDGVESSYAEHFGVAELKAVPGKKVEDPMQFRRPYLTHQQRRTG